MFENWTMAMLCIHIHKTFTVGPSKLLLNLMIMAGKLSELNPI